MISRAHPGRQHFALGDYRVWRIGYGAMQLSGDGVFGPPRDRDEALAVLRAATSTGINYIDTAQYYAWLPATTNSPSSIAPQLCSGQSPSG
jgi:aryl-alcohol dehydrogenase-like predicted oxidoreductase